MHDHQYMTQYDAENGDRGANRNSKHLDSSVFYGFAYPCFFDVFSLARFSLLPLFRVAVGAPVSVFGIILGHVSRQ